MAELNGNLAFRNERSSLDKCLNTVGMSSLFADTNFLLPNGAFLDKSGSADMESYFTLNSSPKPFSSSNLSSSVMDASRVFSQNTLVDQSNQQGHKRQKLHQVARPGALVEHKSQDLLSLLIGMKQEPSTLMQVAKKRMMDMNLDDILRQQIQQLLLKEDIEQLQDNNTQALIQHYMQNKSGQQMVISTPNACATRAQQSEQRVRNQLRQQATYQNSSMQSGDDG